MFKYACEFTVSGVGRIPFDMLRYDRCTPLTQKDASECESPSYYVEEPVSIRLVRHTEGKGRNYADNPTVKRWKSFGWTVSDVTFRKL